MVFILVSICIRDPVSDAPRAAPHPVNQCFRLPVWPWHTSQRVGNGEHRNTFVPARCDASRQRCAVFSTRTHISPEMFLFSRNAFDLLET